MAQVRKFNTGGKTAQIGAFVIDSNNAKDMELLRSMTLDSEYGGIAQSILDNLESPDYSNSYKMYRTSDGRIVTEGELQSVKDKYMSKGVQKATSRKPGFFNDTFKRESAKEYGRSVDKFLNAFGKLRTESNETPTSTDLKKITGVSDIGQWVYNDDGTWSVESPENIRLLEQLQFLEDYFNASEEDRKNKFDVSDLDPEALDAWLSWRGSSFGKAFDPILFTAGAKPLSENDPFFQQYRWFGFKPESKEGSSTKIQKELKEYLDEKGIKWDGIENDFVLEDGRLKATDNFLSRLGLTGSDNYWFNDDWNSIYLRNKGSNPYAFLKGKILWNGVLYDEADVLPQLDATDYHEAIGDRDALKANKILKTFWSHSDFENDSPWGYAFGNDFYSPLTYNKNRSGRQLESSKDVEIIEYWVPIPNDPFARKEKRYAYIDPTTSSVKENLTASEILSKDLGITKDSYGNFVYKKDLSFGQPIINGLYLHSPVVGNDWRLWKDPRDGGNYWFGHEVEGKSPGLYRIPTKIYELLKQNGIWDRMYNDRTESGNVLRQQIFELLKELAQSDSTLQKDFSVIIYSPLHNAIKEELSNPYRRPEQYYMPYPMVSGVPMQKAGGVLKFQSGGVKAKVAPKEVKIPILPYDKNENADDKWTEADSWELGALIADATSSIVTLVSPINAFGAVAGLGGTVANTVADIKKDGFQFKDLATGFGNLLLDFGTALPVVGDAIGATRIAKIAKKLAPLLLKGIRAGAIVGVTQSSIGLLNRIASGDIKNFTKDDARAILNIINGFTTLKRVGMSNIPTKKITNTFGDLKSVDGSKKIKLDSEAIKRIKAEDPNSQLLKAQEEIVSAHKQAYPSDNDLSSNEILEMYEIPTTSEATKWYTPWNRNKVPNISHTKEVTIPMTAEEVGAINTSQGKGSFKQWLSGTGGKQQLYQRQAYGDLDSSSKIHYSPGYNINPGYLMSQLGSEETVTAPTYNLPEYYVPSLKKGGALKAQDGAKTKVPRDMEWTPIKRDLELPTTLKYDSTNDIKKWEDRLRTQHTPVKSPIIADPSSVLVEPEENKYLKASWLKGTSNYLFQLAMSEFQKNAAYNYANKYGNALSRRHVTSPNILSNTRFVDFNSDSAKKTSAQYLSNINNFNVADSGLTLAGKLSGLENWHKFNSELNDKVAETHQKQDELFRQNKIQQNLYDTEAVNQNNEFAVNADIAELISKQGAFQTDLVQKSNIINNRSTENRNVLNKMGQLEASLKTKANDARNKAYATSDLTTRKGFLDLANTYDSDEYKNLMLNSLGYVPKINLIKKGGSLRPVHEQMLINNQKLVARAIEKINDNTMKILLKLLS